MGIIVAIPLVIGYVCAGRRRLRKQKELLDTIDPEGLAGEERERWQEFHAQLHAKRPRQLKKLQVAELRRWQEQVNQTTDVVSSPP